MSMGPTLSIMSFCLVFSIIFIQRYRTNIANVQPKILSYVSLIVLSIVCAILYQRFDAGIAGAFIIVPTLLFFWLSILTEGISENGFYIYFRPLPSGHLAFKDVTEVKICLEEKGLLLQIYGKGYEINQMYPEVKEDEIRSVLHKNAVPIIEY